MPRELLPHIKRVRTKGKDYFFFNTGQKRANGATIYATMPAPTDPKFPGRYAAMCAGRTKRANIAGQLTVPQMADQFRKSPQFKDLALASRKAYDLTLDRLTSLLPTAPASGVESKDIRKLMNDLHETPGAANMLMRVTGALYLWGRRAGLVSNEPCRDVAPFGLREHEAWPEEILQAGLKAKDPKARLAIHMLYYTAQRIGDVSRARWSDLRDGVWTLTQGKTKKPMLITLHADLRAELARHSPQGPFLFVGHKGAPAKTETIRAWIEKAVGDSVVPHGLRKNAVVALLEAGCSVAETAAVSGQSLRIVEFYAKARNQRMLGGAAILQWEKRSGTK